MEKQLIKHLQNKDPESIKNIINKYNKKLFSLAVRFTNNIHDAEDILQEVWVKFFYSLKNFKEKSSLYTYLYKITVNESLMWLRKNKVKKLLLPFKEKADYHTPETEYLQKEEWKFINQAITKLPFKQKKIFILRNENIPFMEISEILNIKETNAKSLYFYALKNIKKYLKELKIL